MSRRVRSSGFSGPTARARPRRSGCCSVWSPRPPGASSCWANPCRPAAARALPRVGALIEGPAYHPYLSGEDNLRRLDACDATADPATSGDRIAAALARVGLTAAGSKRFRQYSLGMKQRLGIAGALLQPRDLLVFDEPTNGLDPQGTREVRTLIRELAADGSTVLISSHLLAEIEQVATHVGIMSRGRLLAQGRLEEVLGGAGYVARIETTDPSGASAALQRLGLTLGALACRQRRGPRDARRRTCRGRRAGVGQGQGAVHRD